MEEGRLTREELVKLGLALPLAVAVHGPETTPAATPARRGRCWAGRSC